MKEKKEVSSREQILNNKISWNLRNIDDKDTWGRLRK